jgi:hypothetical protein
MSFSSELARQIRKEIAPNFGRVSERRGEKNSPSWQVNYFFLPNLIFTHIWQLVIRTPGSSDQEE